MAANAVVSHNVEQLSSPPGKTSIPYVLPFLGGEKIYIPTSNSALRLLVTGKETSNAFAVVGTGGVADSPIGFHFHRETHDVFLCFKGQLNVWAGDKCRTMGPGDFVSVPPNTIHQYQVLGPYTEFIGLIVPGGWEEFFRFIGEPYSGPLFPIDDRRNPFEVLIPKLKAAAEEFDMVPVPRHPQFDPQPWEKDSDNQLPNGLEPYFLRNGSGPSFIVGGTICRPLATSVQSGGKFSIASLEGSSFHKTTVLGSSKAISFADTHHCVQVVEGHFEFTVAESKALLAPGETLFIPSGTEFNFKFASAFAMGYIFTNGGGLPELMCKAGSEYVGPVFPEKELERAASSLSSFEKEFNYTLS